MDLVERGRHQGARMGTEPRPRRWHLRHAAPRRRRRCRASVRRGDRRHPAAHELEVRRGSRVLSKALVYIGGYGSVLCAVLFTSYVKEWRHAEMAWDKTEKTGKVFHEV